MKGRKDGAYFMGLLEVTLENVYGVRSKVLWHSARHGSAKQTPSIHPNKQNIAYRRHIAEVATRQLTR